MEQEKQQTEMSLIEQVAKNENITKEEVIAHMVEAIEIGWEKGMKLSGLFEEKPNVEDFLLTLCNEVLGSMETEDVGGWAK